MNIKERKISIKNINKLNTVFIIAVTFLITAGLLMTSLITKKYNYTEGDIAREDVKATRDVVDRIATDAAINKKVSEVPNQYIEKTEVSTQAKEDVSSFLNLIASVKDSEVEDTEKLATIKAQKQTNLTDEDLLYLLSLSNDNITRFKEAIISGLDRVYTNKIEDGNTQDLIEAQNFIDTIFNSSSFNTTLREIGKTIAYGELQPNLFLDEEKTEELKKAAADEVAQVIVKKDQIIIKDGEPITANQIALLSDLGLLNSSVLDWYIYLSLSVLVGVVLFLQYSYLYVYFRDVFEDNKKLILISTVNIIILLLARSISIMTPYLIPLTCASMLLTLLINYKVAMVVSILNCILISCVVNFSLDVTLLAVAGAVLGATFLKKMQQRNDIMISTLYSGVIICIIMISMSMLTSNNTMEILKNTGLVFVGSLFSGVLTIGLLPLLETTFDIITVVKLLELSNPNHPLLRKILMEAPGTYNHSIMVANLAEQATEEVGGNSVLARVASYYHDAGKTKRPYFFKENQIGNDNPHNKISPNLSSLIIISHVKDGLELAKEHNLPKVIQDVIEQHHGTTLVKYFYVTMKNSSDNPDEVKEEDFRYPGPLPSSKESAVIMLADSVEAAVRSINEPTVDKIEQMVNNIIKDKLSTGQLDNCDLTFKDVEKIRRSFLKTLSGIYHSRIEYPTLKQKI